MKFSAAALFLVSSTTFTFKAEGSCPKDITSCVKKCARQNKCKKLNKVGKVTRCESKCTKKCTRKFKRCSKTDSPTTSPTDSPTTSPTMSPTASPTTSPTMSPTTSPTAAGPTAGPAEAVSAGSAYVCAIIPGGDVKCFGQNDNGNLGDGTKVSSYTGDAVTALISGKATSVSTGHYHTCVILDSGALECMGYNNYGQLGTGSTTLRYPTPVAVDLGGAKAIDVKLSNWHSCVALDNGGVKCMGWNGHGSLGNGSNTLSRTPVDVVGLSGKAIGLGGSLSYGHTCAVISGGGVDCWGTNNEGQLGDGTKGNTRNSPKPVVGLSGKAVSVSTGYFFTCVLLDSGDVQCFGDNRLGQLGDGTKVRKTTPTTVISLGAKAIALSCGYDHSCVLLQGGDIKCFGHNSQGQIGDGSLTQRLTAVSVVGLGGKAVSVSAGARHTCAILADDSMKCWGVNDYGSLGDYTRVRKLTPVPVFAI